jgi:hypothetical protein
MQSSTIGRLPEEYQHSFLLDANKAQRALTAIAIAENSLGIAISDTKDETIPAP